MAKLAVIGGTGLTKIDGLEVIHRQVVNTPYGVPSGQVIHGNLKRHEIMFLARHGYAHCIPPHKINYRANIWALQHLGAENIVAVSSVGGIAQAMSPQTLVVPDQLIDYTHARPQTFFEEGLKCVEHIDFSQPYTPLLRQALLEAGKAAKVPLIDGATYGVTQGPRLETAAEIARLERDGCHVVGMTAMPEAALAREVGLNYASCNVVSNWAAGKSDQPITMDEIRNHLTQGMQQVRLLLQALVQQ